jgi:hypothetical protein
VKFPEVFDHGEKFLRDQHWNPTLTDACTLHLAEVYDRIEFPVEHSEPVIEPIAT